MVTTTNKTGATPVQWARQVRKIFVATACRDLPALDQKLEELFVQALSRDGTQQELQRRRDAYEAHNRGHRAWVAALTEKWQALPETSASGKSADLLAASIEDLELVNDSEMEKRIFISRLSQVVVDGSGTEFGHLAQRMEFLEGKPLSTRDVLQPGTMTQAFVDSWLENGFTQEMLQMAAPVIQKQFTLLLAGAARAANAWLIEHDVMPRISLASKIRPLEQGAGTSAPAGASAQHPAAGAQAPGSAFSPPPAGGYSGGTTGFGFMVAPAAVDGGMAGASAGGAALASGAGFVPAGVVGGVPQAYGGAAPRGSPPPGVMQQMQQMLVQYIPGFAPPGVDVFPPPVATTGMGNGTVPGETGSGMAPITGTGVPSSGFAQVAVGPSPALLEALGRLQQANARVFVLEPGEAPSKVARLAQVVRERTKELKGKTDSESEKAIIEVVALMFQSILAEEHLPAGIRVWFARLQVPVLRVALADPEFFEKEDHPARHLIDRMGGCVLGFDSAHVGNEAQEAEIRRIVQIIEQYPETGRQVFEVVLKEFEQFLARHLPSKGNVEKLVGVAQQVEERETLAVQYTIELRDMLHNVPVPDEIRQFLLKTWTEILATSAVRNGAQHEETLLLKQTATDLLWAVCSGPDRAERSKVIAMLPRLIAALRQGMALYNMGKTAQETHIKILHEALTQTFTSTRQGIPKQRLEAIAQRLASLEDVLEDMTEDEAHQIVLNNESINELLDMGDEARVYVAANNSNLPVNPAAVEWASNLKLGDWFRMDHNGQERDVQYVWRSERRQLHLLLSPAGDGYFFQLNRLAAYAQVGLLAQHTREPLTQNATRDALAKIRANPERLLQ